MNQGVERVAEAAIGARPRPPGVSIGHLLGGRGTAMSLLGREAAAVTVVLGMDRLDVDGAVDEITSRLPGTRVLVLPADAATTCDLVSALADFATGARVPAPRDGAADLPRLTAREAEVLDLVVSGLTCRQIAGRLVLSRRTVENHVQRMMRKLVVRNRAELVRAALSRELV